MRNIIPRNIYPLFISLGAAIAISICLAADNPAPVPAGAVARIGDPAPEFVLPDQNGVNVDLASFANKVVVLEWTNPDCPFVQWHYQHHTMFNLAAQYQVKGVVWLSINSSHDDTNDFNKKWVADQGLFYPVLNDASGAVGHAYGATNTPGMFIIGKNGKLLYRGAIDDDPSQSDRTDKINYVAQALTEVLANKPVTVPETKQYGCSVKYSE
jgi:peroxiredoxin